MTARERYEAVDTKMREVRVTCTDMEYFDLHIEKMRAMREMEKQHDRP